MRFHVLILTITLAYGLSFPLITLEFGANLWEIGLAGAAPALAWLLLTPAIPWALRRLSLTRLAQGLLALALLAWACMALWREPLAWIALRLVFGGALGLFFRCVEFWLNATTPSERRGSTIGLYGTVFLLGIVLGAALQPLAGSGALAFAVVGTGLAASILILALGAPLTMVAEPAAPALGLGRILALAPEGLAAAAVYGLFEAIPVNLLPKAAIDLGFAGETAALAVSVFVLGALLGTLPAGWVSDRLGRVWLLRLASLWGCGGAVLLPLVAAQGEAAWLAGLFLWAFGTQGIYGVALALIGDRFGRRVAGDGILQANMAFGMAYAAGALVGPLYAAGFVQLRPGSDMFGASALLFGLLVTVVLVVRSPLPQEESA